MEVLVESSLPPGDASLHFLTEFVRCQEFWVLHFVVVTRCSYKIDDSGHGDGAQV